MTMLLALGMDSGSKRQSQVEDIARVLIFACLLRAYIPRKQA